MIHNVSFKGIIPPYTNAKGYYVTPIAKNPQQEDIDRAIAVTKSDDAHSGLNGRAYFYGQDLVVKKYKNPDEVNSYNPYREIKALDSMFDYGVLADNMQRGEFAFTTPESETFLVSTKVKGSNANPITNKLNKKNLNSIVQTLYTLDIPHKYPSQPFENKKFPYVVPMHYDISMGNYNITDDEGGIFDFEYLNYEDLNKPFTNMNYQYMPDTLPDLSDISGIVSNLRNFEYRGLLPYLKQVDTAEAKQLFVDFIGAKSQYHLQRAHMFAKEGDSVYLENPSLSSELYSLASKEYIHHFCLKELSPEVLKAEAIKIQLASFIYLQSPFSHSLTDKINPSEIRKYLTSANSFFEEHKNVAKGDEKLYFQDCCDLMKSWNNLPFWMDYQETKPNLKDYMPSNSEISYYDEEKLAQIRDEFQNRCNIYELFQNKVTTEHLVTLDEHLQL